MKQLGSVGVFLTFLLFTYTSIDKLTHLKDFQTDLSKSILIPDVTIPWLAYILPLFELLISLGFLTHRFFLMSLKNSIILMSLFTIYVSIIYYFSPDIPCSCGGIISNMSWPQHILLNFSFLLLLLIAYKSNVKRII